MTNMTGRKDLMARKVPQTQAIEVKPKINKGLHDYNIKQKMSKVMKAKGMIKEAV